MLRTYVIVALLCLRGTSHDVATGPFYHIRSYRSAEMVGIGEPRNRGLAAGFAAHSVDQVSMQLLCCAETLPKPECTEGRGFGSVLG